MLAHQDLSEFPVPLSTGNPQCLMGLIACAFHCSVFMGNMDVPTQNNQPIKMPMGTYEFGANLASSSVTPPPPFPPSGDSKIIVDNS